jgi:alkylation response protein AidB-like acyl-CoA dehydrogenase
VIPLDLSEEEQLLRETAGRFLDRVCPLSTVRALLAAGKGPDPDYISQIGEMGWLGLLAAEESGAAAAAPDAVRYLAILAEQYGRRLQPGPLLPMNVVIAAIGRTGTRAQRTEILPRLVSGTSVATWVLASEDGSLLPGDPVRAEFDGDEVLLTGTGVAQDGEASEWLLVGAAGQGGQSSQFLVRATEPGITLRPLSALDVTRRYASVSFEQVRVLRGSAAVGSPETAAADTAFQLNLATVLQVAETIGCMDALFGLTVRYAKDRYAFGRQIGGFQAVKHQLADASLAVETSRAVCDASVRALNDNAADATEIASLAKSWVNEAGISVAQACFQVFGGIGFTWEHDLHLYLRRITMNSFVLGSTEWHRDRICKLHGL